MTENLTAVRAALDTVIDHVGRHENLKLPEAVSGE